MADSKITALASIGTGTDPANDPLVIVDVSDVSPGGMSATGTTKKVTLNNLLACSPTATLASATITGDLTVDTSTLKVDSANDRVGIGTATPGGALEVFKNTNGQNRLFLNNPSTGTGAYDAIDFTAGTANNQILSMGSGYSGSFPYLTGALILRSAQANGIVLNTAGSAAAIQFGINDTLGMTLNATGLGVGVVPSAGKGALQLSSGINFPATQVASSDANTLDDYEEGVWSPAVSGEVNLTSTTLVSARYTKIGRLVTVSGSVTTFIITSNTLAYFALQNLPFAAAAIGTAGSLWNDTRNTSGSTSVNGSVFYGFLPAASGTTSGSMMTLNFSISYTV